MLNVLCYSRRGSPSLQQQSSSSSHLAAAATKKPDSIELPPSLANYYEESLTGHVSSWMEEGRNYERAVSQHRYSFVLLQIVLETFTYYFSYLFSG